MDFLALVRDKTRLVKLDESLLKRSVNQGFSGGEKKRNEIFHMAVLEPKLAILDETDSGSRHRRPQDRCRWASTRSATLSAPSFSLPTISGCSTTLCRISSTC